MVRKAIDLSLCDTCPCRRDAEILQELRRRGDKRTLREIERAVQWMQACDFIAFLAAEAKKDGLLSDDRADNS